MKELIEICEELGLTLGRTKRKQAILEIMKKEGVTAEEVDEAWADIKGRREEAERRELREREEAERRELREREREEAERQERLEMKRIELALRQCSQAPSVASATVPVSGHRIRDQLPPFVVGEDMAKYLVKFEHVCERNAIERSLWAQNLLALLPGEVSDVITCLSREAFESYDEVKEALLRRYKLSPEAFRQRFRYAKRGNESHVEFAFRLKADLVEWLKGEDVYDDRDKVVECIALEQFYRCIEDDVKLWLQDKLGEVQLNKAAELAEEYYTRRNLHSRAVRVEKAEKKEGFTRKSDERKPFPNRNLRKDPSLTKETVRDGQTEAQKSGEVPKQRTDTTRAFESRKPLICYHCKKEGHIALNCKQKFAFATIRESEKNMQLLEPYIQEISVNGKTCRALRDSAATMDVVHPSFVSPNDFTGECAWIRQVAEEQSACLPIVTVVLEGSFGKLHTEAAVSAALPDCFPYLFSNNSEQLLKEQGKSFFSSIAYMALTRSQARKLSQELDLVPCSKTSPAKAVELRDLGCESTAPRTEDSRVGLLEQPVARAVSVVSVGGETEVAPLGETGTTLSPVAESWCELSKVDRETLIREQREDSSIKALIESVKPGTKKKNVSFYEKSGLFYRSYTDVKGRKYEQLLIPQKYRRQLVELAHENAWAGHLGLKKTKARISLEFYWPKCWKDTEDFVRSCDTCQRVGKSTDKWKAPMRLVPLITEPFRRLVIDIVGPLPESRQGCRYILTALCVATKFPEAVPLKELNSPHVVDALLSIFARVGFPAEIQCDNGSVFTSCLTSTFLDKCGIKVIHSSIHHPQSNPVERMHSVLKRILRALCYEHKCDWEACIPPAMFALRSAPHESTGFSPAELVYGRSLRTPLRMLRESWEGFDEDPNVVAYVLDLLQRLGKTKDLVESHMKAAQVLSKEYYDKLAKRRTFEVGSQVMLLRPSKKNKLEVHWEGPAKVISKLSDTNYEVKLGRRSNKIYHSNLMKPYVQRQAIVNLLLNASEEEGADTLTSRDLTERGSEVMLEQLNLEPRLSEAQKEDLRRIVSEFKQVFSDRPGNTTVIKHDIELTSEEPISSKPYRCSPVQKQIMKCEIDRMLELGVIVPGESDYTSPLILVQVPGKDPRPCIDYRRLNAITRDQTYPIPNLEERVETVSKSNYISTLDLVRGYWQVPLTERASRYAAFVSPFGTYRPLMLSFGLKNAPYCFSSLMDRVLNGLSEFALPYLDDVAIFSNSWEEHIEHLRVVLNRLKEAGLTAKPAKCHLGCSEVSYLGHVVGRGRRRPSEIKVAAVMNYPRPTSKSEIRAFLGLAGYYQHYVPNYSSIASPLTDALRKSEPVKVTWDSEKEKAFCTLKQALSKKPVLMAPDFSKGFIIQCDASERGMGAILCQKDSGGNERPVLYLSRKLSCREEAYSTSEKECACVVWAVQKLACYVSGSKFVVETDHCPLTWLNNMSSKSGRLLRWSMILQQHNLDVRYKKGKLNANADALSRAF